MIEPYMALLVGVGALVLLTAWLPMLLREAPLSLPIACVAIGAVIWSIPGVPGSPPDPLRNALVTERLTETVVIISLMGAGLKIDRPFGWASWTITWRLLGLAMPITILALAVLGHLLLGLGAATALLLAAALAPTDPVLASDVQVGPPMSGQEDETRFALTSEAGLNDGLAFPFVLLALTLAGASGGDAGLGAWFLHAVVWKLGVGLATGLAIGRALGWLAFRLPNRAQLSGTGDGFVALGITALAYGLTELAGGYGFLAVFVAGVALRSVERHHTYHERLHDFAEQLERLLMMGLLVLFGGALTGGALLRDLSWEMAAFAALALLVVRPVAGWIGLAGAGCPNSERAVISFFGIRGIGSFYYVAYALTHDGGAFDHPELLWGTIGLVVAASILLHGTTVTVAMRFLDWQRSGRQLSLGLESPARGVPDEAR